MARVIFAAEGLSYRYPGESRDVVRAVDLSVSPGELVALLGPNGSGKTTLLRLLLAVLRPTAGWVRVLDRPAHAWSRRELARLAGVVVQREEPVFPMTVREAVAMGRYAHLGPLGAFRPADTRAVQRALERCDCARLSGRWVNTLSGGEWQRVRVARALAQEPRALVLDEPTANLDLRYEMEVFELVSGLVRSDGIAALIVTHHVNLAARYADRLLLLDAGEVRATGRPAEVVSAGVLQQVFQWPVEIIDWHGTPQLVPLKKTASGSLP